MTAIIETTPAGATLLKCRNPVTKELLRELECHSLEEVDQALKRLRLAAATYNFSPIR
ncbi:MAG: hypothetical protein IIA60_09750, partial [Candidatus Marinimicrobia bacterium]|nr:hypothetical protein [Candidatus Neomarinimicrobiota bacterium]